MNWTNIFNLQYFDAGTYVATTTVPAFEYFAIRANQTEWPLTDTDCIQILAELSYDSGDTYSIYLGFTAMNVDGEEYSSAECVTPSIAPAQLRITLTAYLPIQTSIDIQVA